MKMIITCNGENCLFHAFAIPRIHNRSFFLEDMSSFKHLLPVFTPVTVKANSSKINFRSKTGLETYSKHLTSA